MEGGRSDSDDDEDAEEDWRCWATALFVAGEPKFCECGDTLSELAAATAAAAARLRP